MKSAVTEAASVKVNVHVLENAEAMVFPMKSKLKRLHANTAAAESARVKNRICLRSLIKRKTDATPTATSGGYGGITIIFSSRKSRLGKINNLNIFVEFEKHLTFEALFTKY